MRILSLWHLPIDPIRDYFGEKIALYFSFITYYGKSKLFMAIVGLICYILQQIFLSRSMVLSYKWTTLVYGVFVLFWSIFFSEYWKRREALFALKYG